MISAVTRSEIKALTDQKTKAIEGKVQEALSKLKGSNQAAQGPIDAKLRYQPTSI